MSPFRYYQGRKLYVSGQNLPMRCTILLDRHGHLCDTHHFHQLRRLKGYKYMKYATLQMSELHHNCNCQDCTTLPKEMQLICFQKLTHPPLSQEICPHIRNTIQHFGRNWEVRGSDEASLASVIYPRGDCWSPVDRSPSERDPLVCLVAGLG